MAAQPHGNIQQLLVISNGHGEDRVAMRILQVLRQDIPKLSVDALPIVGIGQSYGEQTIPRLVKGKALVSGGFGT